MLVVFGGAVVDNSVVTDAHADVVNDQELNDNGIWSIAVGLTRSASTQDLISMSSSSNDYVRFPGNYSDLQANVSDVVRLLCAIRPKSQFLSVVYKLREHFFLIAQLVLDDRRTVFAYTINAQEYCNPNPEPDRYPFRHRRRESESYSNTDRLLTAG